MAAPENIVTIRNLSKVYAQGEIQVTVILRVKTSH